MDKTAVYYDEQNHQLFLRGHWNLAHLSALSASLDQITFPSAGEVIFNGQDILTMDSAGALLITQWQHRLIKKHINVRFEDFKPEHLKLLELVENKIQLKATPPKKHFPSFVYRIGKMAVSETDEIVAYLNFVGKLTMEFLRIFSNTKHIRWNAFATVIYRNGYQALPIIAMLSFMIGVVISYQMGLQLKNYGANLYIVDLVGYSILREFAPLITAIMIAGRTGSAFTAQLGIMQINQEIDSLNTMGVTPGELLILPRIAGLLVALPLLTMWSNIFGVFGGMVMAHATLKITWYDFIRRFPLVIPLRTFMIGMGKAPVFALIIGSIGCFEGMRVQGSADSVGRNTTRSVVLSIFFIIVVDAAFSVIFSRLKL